MYVDTIYAGKRGFGNRAKIERTFFLLFISSACFHCYSIHKLHWDFHCYQTIALGKNFRKESYSIHECIKCSCVSTNIIGKYDHQVRFNLSSQNLSYSFREITFISYFTFSIFRLTRRFSSTKSSTTFHSSSQITSRNYLLH